MTGDFWVYAVPPVNPESRADNTDSSKDQKDDDVSVFTH